MALRIDEKKMVEDNMFGYEERVKSPLSRFSNKTFTPVDYHHINNVETTADEGFGDVENILGERSPIRFQVIHDLPLYGLEAINLDFNDGDVGLDNEYSGEAVLLPGTIKPLQNDFFVLPQLKNTNFIFRVTEVQQDGIMADNYYKLSFRLEFNDESKTNDLERQTTEKFTCLLENIGTDERCIIEEDYFEDVKKIDKMYASMLETYLTLFYNKRYNCLLADYKNGTRIYDPFQTEFIMKHELFKLKNQLDNVVFTEQFADPKRKLKYERTIYRFIETKDLGRLTLFPFCTFLGINNRASAFFHWHDINVKVLDIQSDMPQDSDKLLTQDAYDIINMNYPTDSLYLSLIAKYMRNDNMALNDISLDLEEPMLASLDANAEIFFYTPIIMYIIKDVVHNFMLRKKEK